MSTTAPVTQILFFDGVDDLDPVGPLEILTAAGLRTTPVRPTGHPAVVHTAHGLVIEVAAELDDRAELVIVPGGGWRDDNGGVRDQIRGALPDRLAAMHAGGAIIASVCTGAMVLAAAGLLIDRPAVTNRIALDDLVRAGARGSPGGEGRRRRRRDHQRRAGVGSRSRDSPGLAVPRRRRRRARR